MDTGEITLIVFDEKENYEDVDTQSRLGVELYKRVHLVQNALEFDRRFTALKPNEKFIVIGHVFHAPGKTGSALRGLRAIRNSGIEKKYHIKIHLVSSGISGEVAHDIWKTTSKTKEVYLYNTFNDELENERIEPYTKEWLTANHKIPETAKRQKKGIFLSHSSVDREIVKSFQTLVLEGGLNYPSEKVKFTGVETHGIPGGVNIPADLQKFIKTEMGLFIQFISADYIKSRVCLNEEGAAWCLLEDLMFVTILVPPATIKDQAWLKTGHKAIELNHRDSIMNLFEDRKSFFGNINVTKFSSKVAEFVQIAQSTLDYPDPPKKSGQDLS